MKKVISSLLRSLVYLIMVVFPLLLGWGLRDLRGFFRDPARAGFFALCVAGVVTLLIPRLNVPAFKKGSKVVGSATLQVVLAGMMVLSVFLPYADRRSLVTFDDVEAIRWAGLGLSVLGTVVRIVGVWSLGRQFSSYVTLQENHQLVKAGLYQYIRHPMYLGMLILMVGMPLVFRSWLVFPATLLTLWFALVRMNQEERLLAEHFAQEFEAYRRRTWRLVPYVY